MKDRVKKIRKDAHVNQTEFGESINLTRQMVALVETDRAAFSDRSIRDICRVYKVNEEWLRTGKGEPYPTKTRNQEIAEFMNEVMECDDTDFKNQLIYALTVLDEDDWKKIADLMKKIIERGNGD